MNDTVSTTTTCIICNRLLDIYEINFDGRHCTKCRWAYEHITAVRNGDDV